MNEYQENGYIIIPNFIPNNMSLFFREYLNTLKINNQLESGDPQVNKSHTIYGDPALDTFLLLSTPMISKITGIDLLPTYSYARIYYKDSELLPHLDRPECEHSFSISFGGESNSIWPIWLKHKDAETYPVMVALYEGDCVIYKGTELYHWRDKFEGTTQYQLFCHYVDANGPYKDQLYDKRPFIGLPAHTKK